MSRIVEKKPHAKVDLVQHYVYIGQDNLDAAERFLSAVEDATAKLAEMPRDGDEAGFHDTRIGGNPVVGGEGFRELHRLLP